MRKSIFIQAWLLALQGVVFAGCDNPQDPVSGSDIALLGSTSSYAEHLFGLDLSAGRVIARPGPVDYYHGPFAPSPDWRKVYLWSGSPNADGALLTLDVGTLTIRSRHPLPALSGPAFDEHDLAVLASDGMLVSSDNRFLLITALDKAASAISRGIAVLEINSFAVVDFIAGVNLPTAGSSSPGFGSSWRGGGTFVLGESLNYLLEIDLDTHEVMDSVLLVPPADAERDVAVRVQAAPDGEHIYVVTRMNSLHKVSWPEKRVVASTSIPAPGNLAVAPAGDLLYMTDPGTRDFPGSGFLYVYDSDLQAREAIDLREASVDGVPPVTGRLVVSGDGKMVYVAAGTPRLGSLYPPQHGRVLAVDVSSREGSRIIPYDAWAASEFVLLP